MACRDQRCGMMARKCGSSPSQCSGIQSPITRWLLSQQVEGVGVGEVEAEVEVALAAGVAPLEITEEGGVAAGCRPHCPSQPNELAGNKGLYMGIAGQEDLQEGKPKSRPHCLLQRSELGMNRLAWSTQRNKTGGASMGSQQHTTLLFAAQWEMQREKRQEREGS